MNGRRVLIGVTGGIAAFKTAVLVSRLTQVGAETRVIMTRSAHRFVGRATFAALSGRPVATRVFDVPHAPLGPHVELARWGELLCIAPATANFLAKAASGLADDLLSTVYLAFQGPICVAPSMNDRMWKHPAVRRNASRIAEDGVDVLVPDEGWLSCREVGSGRMVEPDALFEAIRGRLAGK
ncbi:MAG: phosphopantothenoylcysteine decarboxylase [Planctomycetes bacterium]|nr:phosphopantothenoylcysteine decarboxylase [Planctomycetota bacterium]